MLKSRLWNQATVEIVGHSSTALLGAVRPTFQRFGQKAGDDGLAGGFAKVFVEACGNRVCTSIFFYVSGQSDAWRPEDMMRAFQQMSEATSIQLYGVSGQPEISEAPQVGLRRCFLKPLKPKELVRRIERDLAA